MSELQFSTREEALVEAEKVFLPAGTEWTTNVLSQGWNAARSVLSRHGALPTTMHFGLMELDVVAREVRFTDQDHRDGGDFVIHRAPLSEAWITRLLTLER